MEDIKRLNKFASEVVKMANKTKQESPGEEKVEWSVCAHHCGGICLLKVHVKDGVITRIEADDGEEPQLRPCLRGHSLRQKVYAPDRLGYPLKRVGARGSGEFQRISWDEALDTVASELKRVKETYGNSAILLPIGCGNVTLLHGMGGVIEKLLSMFGGYTGQWGWMSWEAATFASVVQYGTMYVDNSRDDLLNSGLIILWGINPVNTIHSTNCTWYLAQAKEKGIPIVSIDPRYTASTGTLATQWIPIRPSTDTAMALAMAYVIIKENLQDQAFLDRYTIGFEQFKDYVLGVEDNVAKTPRWAQSITAVPAATIEKLARDYATTKPAALISGICPGRTAFGEQFHRSTMTLAAMTGNIGNHGGNSAARSLGDQHPFNFYPFKIGKPMPWGGSNPVDDEAPTRELALRNYKMAGVSVPRSYARVHGAKWPDAILKGRSGGYHADYKLLFVINANPVNQAPVAKKWVEALDKLEFIVVMEQFMTATARYADIILPTCTLLERNDIIAGGSTPFYGFLKKVIEPLYETKSQLQIGIELAERLGISDYCNMTEDELLRNAIMVEGSPVTDWDTFKKKAIYRVKLAESYVAFKEQIEDPENNPFPTPSGKIEIYSQELADMKNPLLPPIPKWFTPKEGPDDPLVVKYPLQLITSRFKRRAHTQFDTIPWLRELEENQVMVNADDAKARGISDGDMVRVFNDWGEIIISGQVTERIMPGVVDVPQGAWFTPDENGIDRGGCPNVLERDEYSPCGSFIWNTALVQVEKAK